MKTIFATLAILHSLSLAHVQTRDEGRIFTSPQDSVNGSFVFPRTYPLTFREGSGINISWSTTYQNINLYYYQRGKVANSVQLVTNLATQWYQWEIRSDEPNLTNPFVFRVVNAQGTPEEQSGGGFWSTSWYLARDGSASESITSSSLASSSSTSSPSSSSTTASSSTASASPSPVTSSESPSSTTPATSTEATVAPNTAATSSSGLGKSAIIGLAVGLVIAGAIIIVGVLFFLRKWRKSIDASLPLPAASDYNDKAYAQMQPEYIPAQEVYVPPSELHGVSPCHELASTK